jgi:hypothetical protein
MAAAIASSQAMLAHGTGDGAGAILLGVHCRSQVGG